MLDKLPGVILKIKRVRIYLSLEEELKRATGWGRKQCPWALYSVLFVRVSMPSSPMYAAPSRTRLLLLLENPLYTNPSSTPPTATSMRKISSSRRRKHNNLLNLGIDEEDQQVEEEKPSTPFVPKPTERNYI